MLDFVVVGPQRTGTSWLDAVLRTHPDLCLPNVLKETMFFDRRFDMGRDRYLSYFAHGHPGQLRGEVSPSYFHRPDAAQRIRTEAPTAKIVILLRDPTEKTFSLFLHHLAKGRVPNDVERAIEAMPELIESARYAQWVPMWQQTFGHEHVLLLPFTSIARAPSDLLRNLYGFLGVGQVEPPATAFDRVNQAKAPRYPALARLAARTVTRLHDAGLHRLVAAGKRLGLSAVYSGGERTMPTLGVDQRAKLDALLAEDRAFVDEASRTS